MQNNPDSYDYVIVGSGFGGSVCALRLMEKGYKVLLIEEGKRFADKDFAKSNWNLRRYLWAPLIKCFGIQRLDIFKGIFVLRGAGYGGGSLVYANTLMQPRDNAFKDTSWPSSIDWQSELRPHYHTAKQMLGVTNQHKTFVGEDKLLELATEMGVEESYHKTDIGVYISDDPSEKDPYFSGNGPLRQPCNYCGGCMVGCRFGAKNTLVKNYLYFAEKLGLKVLTEHRVSKITPENGAYKLRVKRSTKYFVKSKEIKTKKIILAAGVIGSLEILMKNKYEYKTLPQLSDQLGQKIRTNGESLLGVTSLNKANELGEYSKGVAIGAAIHPDECTKIESVRYSAGSDFMKMISCLATPDGSRLSRPLKLLYISLLKFPTLVRLWLKNTWAENSMILLVMQSTSHFMKFQWARKWYGKKGLVGNNPVPSYLPVAQRALHVLAKKMKGVPQNALPEVALGATATAHVLGGCVLSSDVSSGVVDTNHQVYGYPGIYVCDGSVVPANLGVNPSLSITALAERFCQKIPSKQ